MSNGISILLVEDDFNLGFVIQDLLRLEGYKVHLAKDGKEGLMKFNQERYDLCLLDVMLPAKDGFTLAEDIRKVDTQVPIVFLTAKAMPDDKVRGFQTGADDYITKPFENQELLLRIKAILKRTGNTTVEADAPDYNLGQYSFDPDNYNLCHGETCIKLTKKEAELLKLLCEHRERVIERDLIANMIWGDDSYFVGRSMDVFITRLRKHLSADANIAIENVHGVGFRLTAVKPAD
jgi:DNA-binding response OmpR family regulator